MLLRKSVDIYGHCVEFTTIVSSNQHPDALLCTVHQLARLGPSTTVNLFAKLSHASPRCNKVPINVILLHTLMLYARKTTHAAYDAELTVIPNAIQPARQGNSLSVENI